MKRALEDELLELVNVVRAHRGRAKVESLSPELRLREELGFDSLDLAELTVRVEERFGVDVFADGIVHQWGDLQDRVERHARRV